MVKFYDVSLPIREGMVLYPRNPEVSIKLYTSISLDKTNESLITLGSHTGTHVDSMLPFRVKVIVRRLCLWTVSMGNVGCWT